MACWVWEISAAGAGGARVAAVAGAWAASHRSIRCHAASIRPPATRPTRAGPASSRQPESTVSVGRLVALARTDELGVARVPAFGATVAIPTPYPVGWGASPDGCPPCPPATRTTTPAATATVA